VKHTILLVDDDRALSQLVSQYLEKSGYQVTVEDDGANAVRRIVDTQPSLVILDVMLPNVDGLTICRRVREEYKNPIIMLTALDEDIDEVVGLETGADDYLAKPIKPRVLLAHVRAQLRRSDRPLVSDLPARTAIVETQELLIDAGSRSVSKNGAPILLTTAEFDLLWMLASCPGEVVKRDELHQRIFKLEYDGVDRSIDLRVSRLRKKLGDDSKTPHIIKTIRNVGYQLALN